MAEISPTPFRFLDLPAEIRLTIYEFLFVCKWHTWHCMDPPFGSIWLRGLTAKMPIIPVNLLQTCRQVYLEARKVLYSNAFFIHSTDLIQSTLIENHPHRHCVPIHLIEKLQVSFLIRDSEFPQIGFSGTESNELFLYRQLRQMKSLKAIELAIQGTSVIRSLLLDEAAEVPTDVLIEFMRSVTECIPKAVKISAVNSEQQLGIMPLEYHRDVSIFREPRVFSGKAVQRALSQVKDRQGRLVSTLRNLA